MGHLFSIPCSVDKVLKALLQVATFFATCDAIQAQCYVNCSRKIIQVWSSAEIFYTICFIDLESANCS